jgi:hypothetical protein
MNAIPAENPDIYFTPEKKLNRPKGENQQQ